ncbi:metallophosphoesterase [Streptomyces asoensis]|uniref:Metallophosphoesterase n=2 Tax=Streptomyces asoensis TaxID=249586 RepID=A0A6M4WVU6_9ACTN|nr:metallophosphoesterase [Streptomyces asoensis]
MPSPIGDSESLQIFDPLPPIKAIADNPEIWPGVLFWAKGKGEAFVPAAHAEELFIQLSREFDHGVEALSAVMDKYNSTLDGVRSNQILHLSDLHFGTDEAQHHEAYFETWLGHILPAMDRVVITGDVFDSTREVDFWAFDRFYRALSNACPKDPILVPGNHDQRVYGLKFGKLGEDTRFLSRIAFHPGVLADDDLRCVFLLFNSSEGQDFARGEVSIDQRRRVATQLLTEYKRSPQIAEYSRIALVHHHPIPYSPQEARPIQKGLKGLFMGNEKYIEMRDSEEFLKWCAKRDVPLILHGHKHLPRHRLEGIFENGRFLREITAVGCGASLGKGTGRLAYNVVKWHPEAERWSAKFFSGPIDGSEFSEDFVTLYRGTLENRPG